MTRPKEDNLIWVGRLVKTQGIKGEGRVLGSGGKIPAFSAGKGVYLEGKDGIRRPFTVDSSRPHKGMAILSFREVRGIEEAEELVGCSIYMAKEDLEPLAPDEFYWYQLQGLQVQTEDGTVLGKLEEVFSTGSNDVFVVRKDGQEILLPATEEVIVQVDLKKGVMVIHPLEGLLPEDDI